MEKLYKTICLTYQIHLMAQSASNQWIIGRKPSFRETYIQIEYTYDFSYNSVVVKRSRSLDTLPHAKKAIMLLDKIWPVPFIGYHLHLSLDQRDSLDEKDSLFLLMILTLDRLKLKNWRIFQLAEFYRKLPSDICWEILQYIYDDMIRTIQFKIQYEFINNDLTSEALLAKFRKSSSHPDNLWLLGKNQYAGLIASRNIKYGHHYQIVPERMPTYAEIGYKLL